MNTVKIRMGGGGEGRLAKGGLANFLVNCAKYSKKGYTIGIFNDRNK